MGNGCKSGNFRTSKNKHENCELSSRGMLSLTYDPDLFHNKEFVFISLEKVSLTILYVILVVIMDYDSAFKRHLDMLDVILSCTCIRSYSSG